MADEAKSTKVTIAVAGASITLESPDADVGQLMAQALVGLKEATDGLPLERAYGHTGFTTERGR